MAFLAGEEGGEGAEGVLYCFRIGALHFGVRVLYCFGCVDVWGMVLNGLLSSF